MTCSINAVQLPVLHNSFLTVSDDTSSIAAAGRPFRIGDYYNRPTDELILGKTFWGLEKLQDTVSKKNYRTKVIVVKQKSVKRTTKSQKNQ